MYIFGTNGNKFPSKKYMKENMLPNFIVLYLMVKNLFSKYRFLK